VKYVPDLKYNLFSLTKALTQGCELSSQDTNIIVSKGNFSLTFDRKLKTISGFLPGINLLHPEVDMAAVLAEGNSIKATDLHRMLGHAGKDRLRATARMMKLKLTGGIQSCLHCAVSKAKQANLNKVDDNMSEIAGERLFLDLSSIDATSLGGKKF